ncbi:PIN domain-containing protein [Actinomycetospora soli]|uniref:PIN domain-containing protein n=1 Tax=Actinomycetospora soli TaxID=2893887 RepID=UPI001E612356|nr:PIN domain-containing protein [Actinomycetospora soli]MCD2191641.1 PIN domain-containing protein [Actinomycetospora soli]
MIGKVLDASAVAAIASGQIGATAWVTVALDAASILYVPALAIEEVRALRPDLSPVLDDLALHPSVIVRSLTDREEPVAAEVEQLLDHVGLFDVLAGHVVHIAKRRGWEAMTADSGRLRRIDPDLPLTLL